MFFSFYLLLSVKIAFQNDRWGVQKLLETNSVELILQGVEISLTRYK
tara:strand:+ start:111 stop:251 length:141 start_codon:yes stop_codon:yes gene_type:complete